MIRALRAISGASFERRFKVGSSREASSGMGLILSGVSNVSRDRLLLVYREVAVEVILGCPNCQDDVFKTGAADAKRPRGLSHAPSRADTIRIYKDPAPPDVFSLGKQR